MTITPSQNLSTGQVAGFSFTVNLNRGQGWLATGTASGPSGDLTASTVESTFPVSVTNGVGCVNIDGGVCDHVFEVAQAVQTWGTGIPAANLPGFATTGVRYRIMAADDNTTVLQDGVSIGLLNEGNFLTTPRLTGGHFFEGDEAGSPKPIFVMQLMPGDASLSEICTRGDPSIGNIIPAAQYQSAYTFSTVGGGQFACNFVTIIAENADVGTLTLDGVAVPPGSFTAIGGSGYSSAVVEVLSGVHETVSPAGTHGLTVEGYNRDDSYLYPGGAALNAINVGLILTKDDQVDECVALGATVDYQVCYQKTGDDPANNVSIVDTLPSELDFVSASGSGVYDSAPGTITWSVPTAPANMPAPVCFDLTVTVNGTAPSGGEIVNPATIDSDETPLTRIQERTAVCASTNAPPVALCLDRTVPTDPGVCFATSVDVNNGSYDPDPGDSITLDQVPPNPYPLGPTPVTLTATDTHDATDFCLATVTVVNNEPPTVTCVESVNPSGDNVPKAKNQDGFYLVSAAGHCSSEAAPVITLGAYALAAGETIKITQTPGQSGVTLVNTMGPPAIRHFQVGPGDAIVTATDGSGRTSSVICLVPPPPN